MSDEAKAIKPERLDSRKLTGSLNNAYGTPEPRVNISYGNESIPNVPAIIDTGSFYCMISPQLIEPLGLIISNERGQYINPVLGQVETPFFEINFSFVDLDLDLPLKCRCLIMPHNYDYGLLLGSEFLQDYDLFYYGKKRYFELFL